MTIRRLCDSLPASRSVCPGATREGSQLQRVGAHATPRSGIRTFVGMGAILMTLAVLAACTATRSARPDPSSEAEIAGVLRSLTDEYNAAWEQLDLPRIVEYHAEDLTYYRQGVVAAASPEEFERMYHDEVATQITSYGAETSDLVVKALGPDAGMVAFLFRGEVTTPDGTTHDYSGALSYVFERRAGEWRIVHIHESLLPHVQS